MATTSRAAEDHFNDVKFLLRTISDTDEVHRYCTKECRSAARWGQLELAQFLVENVDEPSTRDQCCHEATEFAASNNHTEVVAFLVKTIVDPNIRDQSCLLAVQSASLKGNLELVELMVNSMLSLDVKTQCYAKAIVFALLNDHTEVANFLLATSTREGVKDKCVNIAASYASSSGHLKVATLLLSHIDKDKKDVSTKKAATLAAEKGQTEMVKHLVQTILSPEVKDQCCIEAAFYAASSNNTDLMNSLMEILTDRRIIGQYSRESARKGHFKLTDFDDNIDDKFCCTEASQAARDGHLGKLMFFLLNIADTKVQDQCCIQASELAGSNNHTEIVSFLVNAASEPNVKLERSMKAVEASARNGHTDMLKYLVAEANSGAEGFTEIADRDHSRTRVVLSAMANGHIEVAIEVASPYFLADPESSQHSLDDAVRNCELYNDTGAVYSKNVPADWPLLHGSQALLDFLAVSAFGVNSENSVFTQSVSRMQPDEISRLLSLFISAGLAGLVNSVSLAVTLLSTLKIADLTYSAEATAGHVELIDRLLNVGASVSAEDSQGRTALSRECKALLERGSSVRHQDCHGVTCE